MFDENFKHFAKNMSVTFLGLISGAGIALILMQYQGIFELRINSKEGYIKLDGSPVCAPTLILKKKQIDT